MHQTTPLVKDIPPKDADLSAWYTAVCIKAELVSYAPVRGCIVLRPQGYGMWERLQEEVNARLKASGHENAYFPLLIPESLLMREAEHVEGFAPEVAWVTHGGDEKLPERLAIRPTSETIIGPMYAQWVQSYRDLPILINQWANVLRWEKSTRPFLRTMEFLWQEGHTAHATEQEAKEEALLILDLYKDVAQNACALPVYAGEKSASERFAGADRTYSIEALMPDGKALQSGTSHELGQKFAKAYGITFAAEDQSSQHAWTTSWGISWRLLGAIIMAHGDDRGLRIPPKLAPVQAVIVPIVKGGGDEAVSAAARTLLKELRAAGLRVKLDDRDDKKPGYKFADWEMRGVPVRVELGPGDLAQGATTLVRRDKNKGEEGAKQIVPVGHTAVRIAELLEDIQRNLFEQAREFLQAHTMTVQDKAEFFRLCGERGGMLDIPWCDRPECEAQVKAQTGAATRTLRPLDAPAECTACGRPARVRAYFAQSY